VHRSWLFILLSAPYGCGYSTELEPVPGDDSEAPFEMDTEHPLDTGPDFCDGVPVVTYANFGESFMTHHCQGCHASTTEDRHDAPESVTFDSVEEVWSWRDRVLFRAAGGSPDMPPMGGPEADDRTRLEWWLRCAEQGT
jgi:hypothetical protein